MGVVYKGQDIKLGRHVALKFLPNELATNHEALERFRREASTASSLNHPNICTIYEVEEHQRQPFIVMELLQGQTLRECLISAAARRSSFGPILEIEYFLDIAIQVADGLQAAHAMSVIHRDIKPTNIFITNGRLVKILDFGLAKLVATLHQTEIKTQSAPTEQNILDESTQLSQSGAIIGTAGYMSPEQVQGDELDARSDLFSFGAILYEMATGQPAFNGSTASELCDAVRTKAPTAIREFNPTFPRALEEVVETALHKNRKLRYQSATELRSDLIRVRQAHKTGKLWTLKVPAFQKRFLEAAAPKEASVGRSMEVVAMVRHDESTAGLREFLRIEATPHITPEDVRERSFEIEFPLSGSGRQEPVDITLRLESPGFDPPNQIKKLGVPPTGDSPACTFLIIPRVAGEHVMNLELLNLDERVMASRSIRTRALPADAEVSADKIIVSIPLALKVRSIAARIVAMEPMIRCEAVEGSDEPLSTESSDFGQSEGQPPSPETGKPDAPRPADFTRIFGGGESDKRDQLPKLTEAVKDLFSETAKSQRTAAQPTISSDGIEASGRYRISEIIGQGGMGTVFKAEDVELGRSVALKVLSGRAAFEEAAGRQFFREVKALSALSHPNIVAIYDVGVAHRRAYITTELLEGTPLDQLLSAHPLEIKTIVSLAIEIADALEAAHRLGIIHRDIKPTNIFVTESGRAKILDFGFSTMQRELNAGRKDGSADIVGRLAYMSPEQVNAMELDARSDLFSFGCVLYEMLAGRRAFRSDDFASLVVARLKQEPIALTQLNPRVPSKLANIVAKALEEDRELRYQSAADMRVDLQALQCELETGNPTGWGARFGRFLPWRKPR
jgi:serine/threonine protein kinase